MIVPHYASLEGALSSLFGPDTAVVHTERVFGGDINKSYALTLNTGDRIFMKTNTIENAAFFTAEAAGLSAIAQTGAIKTPAILCTGTENKQTGYSFLLLHYVESGKKQTDYWEKLAQELAAMHQADTSIFFNSSEGGTNSNLNNADAENSTKKLFGFFQNNFIGARPQLNTPHRTWIDFFRECRLAPQFKAAEHYFSGTERTNITKLLDHLDTFLVEPQKPSLVHGDLWSGNVMCDKNGTALLIDPAVYVGHSEADVAMTSLFGGFPRAFYDAYREANPLQPGYKERLDLYNLYHLLNHLNLFGAGYLNAVNAVVAKFVV